MNAIWLKLKSLKLRTYILAALAATAAAAQALGLVDVTPLVDKLVALFATTPTP